MKTASLSVLYRRLTGGRAARGELPAANVLADVAGGARDPAIRDAVAAAVSASSDHASLAQMLRELQPESRVLAASVAEATRVKHPLRGHAPRHATAPQRLATGRRTRAWASALAAGLVAALALGTWQAARQHATPADRAAMHASIAAAPDRIFSSQDRIFAADDSQGRKHSKRAGDELFKATSDG